MFFLSCLVPLGRFWVPFGVELGPKGVPNHFFRYHVGTMIQKRVSKKETRTNITLVSKLDTNMGGIVMQKQAFRVTRVAKQQFWGNHEI